MEAGAISNVRNSSKRWQEVGDFAFNTKEHHVRRNMLS